MNPNLMSTTDVAKLVGCTVWNLYDEIRRGKVTPARVGKTYLWNEQDVELARAYAATRTGRKGLIRE